MEMCCWKKSVFVVVFGVITQLVFVSGQEKTVTIGALFDSADAGLQASLRHAVERANSKYRHDLKFGWSNTHVGVDQSFQVSKRVCAMLKNGVEALIGPQTIKSSSHVQSMCNALQVPHVEMCEDFRLYKADSSVNVAPHPIYLSKGFAALIDSWKWYDEFTILYEDVTGLARIQELLKVPGKKINIHQLNGESDDDRPLLKYLMKTQKKRFVLECSLGRVLTVLKQADELKMTSEYYDYIVTNMDLHTINFGDLAEKMKMNLTGFQLIDPTLREFHDILLRWRMSDPTAYKDMGMDWREHGITTETALLYDAILLFTDSLNEVEKGKELLTRSYNCDYDMLSFPTNPIIKQMKQANIMGLTGPIFFNEDGFRTNFTLNIIKYNRTLGSDPSHFELVALWTGKEGLNDSLRETKAGSSQIDRPLKVSSYLNKPFLMLKPDADGRTGNDKYEGYIVDLMDEMVKAKPESFGNGFEINPVADKKYGSELADGTWNGMVGEVMNNKADLVAADLTITQARQTAVDFTIPFMNLGITILYKKAEKPPTSLFSFTKPFKDEVWVHLGTVYLAVSVLLFVLARLTPYEWDNPHPCVSEPEELENQFDFVNCMWFAIGSLMQQGCDFLPKAISTRTIAAIWWFFTLIMISSYTANLAAFLTSDKMASAIGSVEDLAGQTEIKYGCVEGGSTFGFFKNSQAEIYSKMAAFMEQADPSVYAKSNDEGVARVLRGNYAFFMESTVIDYKVKRDCRLEKIDPPLDNKGYGIATAKTSPYRILLNEGVLKLQDLGVLGDLKLKWWEDPSIPECDDTNVADDGKLGIENVGGVFVLLFMGVGFAIVVGFCEFVWYTRKIPRRERGTICSEIVKELKFSVNCNEETKPVPKTDSSEGEPENGNNGMSVPLTGFGGFAEPK